MLTSATLLSTLLSTLHTLFLFTQFFIIALSFLVIATTIIILVTYSVCLCLRACADYLMGEEEAARMREERRWERVCPGLEKKMCDMEAVWDRKGEGERESLVKSEGREGEWKKEGSGYGGVEMR